MIYYGSDAEWVEAKAAIVLAMAKYSAAITMRDGNISPSAILQEFKLRVLTDLIKVEVITDGVKVKKIRVLE